MKLMYWTNLIASLIGVCVMIVFLLVGYGEYAYIPLLVSIFSYANTKLIMWANEYARK